MVRGLEDILLGCTIRSLSGAHFDTLKDGFESEWSIFQTNLRPDQIDILILHVGMNDLGKDLPIMKQACEELIDTAFRQLPRAVIALSAILPHSRDPRPLLYKIMDFNAWLANASLSKGFVFIDSFKTFTSRSNNARAGLFKDGLHLNEAGLRAFKDRLVSAITFIKATKIW